MIGQTVAHYRIDRQLGEGGMGVVYAAHDLKLERAVALKVIRAGLDDPVIRDRFWREARAAAALNHPNVCHLYEIREEGGTLFITMELLEGETLEDRMKRGALPLADAVRAGIEILSALGALHQRGFVHRDVKPSNVFLLGDGRIKLLDFGLALPPRKEPRITPLGGTQLTQVGMLVGSPRWMAPEQIQGHAVDARTDLFALAAVLQEAITGRPLFGRPTPVETLYAVLNERPPRLGGSSELDTVGRVLESALSKSPEGRPRDARAMSDALQRAVDPSSGMTAAPPVDRIVRLAVLPFRMLRPHPDLEFLGPSLADAIAMSLAGLRSLVVRSTVATARFASAAPELERIARELDVDVVLTGTVLPAGDRLRVAAQLVEAPGGDVLWSQTSDAGGQDVFEIQDGLVRRIVESLRLPLSARERGAISRDVPASAAAYEFFLRANRISLIGQDFTVARDLYRQALDADPSFAPAWARYGRCLRIVGKYFSGGREENYRLAELALRQALELHPGLPSAEYYMAQLELDGGRVEAALDRLLPVVERNPNDADAHAGLISALRYAGLLELSLAAHDRAKTIDPQILTSVHYTLQSLGETERALEQPQDALGTIRGWLVARIHREPEALRLLRDMEARERGNLVGWLSTLMRAALEGDRASGKEAMEQLEGFPDPEGNLLHATACAKLGLIEDGLQMLERAVHGGYANARLVRDDPWLEPLHGEPRYQAVLAHAEARQRELAARYAGRPAHLVAAIAKR